MITLEKQNYIKDIISDYERDLMGKVFTFVLSDGATLKFEIKPENVPHLLGIPKLGLRQTHNVSALRTYSLLRDGQLTLDHVTSAPTHKEVYKKIINFNRISALLYCGDAVKVVKRVGSIRSQYLIYLDNRPEEIVHLGIANNSGKWYPETLLVLQRNVTAYIDDQIPVDIISFNVD